MVDTESSESLDMRETERERAMASYEFFLVWDGDRLGIAGGSISLATNVFPGILKYEVRWLGSGDEDRSPGAMSGLVGGVDSAVWASESSSDLVLVELLREGRGRSGAL